MADERQREGPTSQPIDRQRALVPVYPTHPRINWGEVALIGAAIAGTVFTYRERELALEQVRLETRRDDSPLAERLEEIPGDQLGLVMDFAAAAYLRQHPRATVEIAQQTEAGMWQRMQATAAGVGRRLREVPGEMVRDAAAFTLFEEAKVQAAERGIDINPLLSLAADLGSQAYDNKDKPHTSR